MPFCKLQFKKILEKLDNKPKSFDSLVRLIVTERKHQNEILEVFGEIITGQTSIKKQIALLALVLKINYLVTRSNGSLHVDLNSWLESCIKSILLRNFFLQNFRT